MTPPSLHPKIRRRELLATAAASLVAGCSEDETPEEPDLSSEGNDDEPIEATAEELLLSSDDLDTYDWTETDPETDQPCRKFFRHFEDAEIEVSLTPCAWVLEDNPAAEDEYETRLERSQKLVGSVVDDDVDVGVEAAVTRDGLDMEVVFRDANAVGRITREMVAAEPVPEEEFPGPEDVVRYAVLMHRGWRE